MKTPGTLLLQLLAVAACAIGTTVAIAQEVDPTIDTGNERKNDRSPGVSSLTVTSKSRAREILQAVPSESALERFEAFDNQGRLISYVAFTDTAIGGLVFVDQKLLGTISKNDARAFYSCRGYATATQNHWAKEASPWIDSLLAAAKPASSVQLEFSGVSTTQSIKSVVENPMVGQVKTLVDMGTNPVNILKTLYNTRGDIKEREEFKKTQMALRAIAPGADESQVAAIIKPEDVSFVIDGLVMAYPKFSVEFYLSSGVVKAIQQPSFHQLSRTRAALFYAASTRWSFCNPQNWRHALPEPRPTTVNQTKPAAKTIAKPETTVENP